MVCKDSYRNKIITYEYSYRDKIDIQIVRQNILFSLYIVID